MPSKAAIHITDLGIDTLSPHFGVVQETLVETLVKERLSRQRHACAREAPQDSLLVGTVRVGVFHGKGGRGLPDPWGSRASHSASREIENGDSPTDARKPHQVAFPHVGHPQEGTTQVILASYLRVKTALSQEAASGRERSLDIGSRAHAERSHPIWGEAMDVWDSKAADASRMNRNRLDCSGSDSQVCGSLGSGTVCCTTTRRRAKLSSSRLRRTMSY